MFQKNNLHDLKGERKEQLLITVDKSGNPIGTATRHECHFGNGKTHMAFMAFVVDKNGLFILTQRSDKKSLWAGFWDTSVVSHVLPGETVEHAANRRGKEELGIDVTFKTLGAFYYFTKHGDSAENEYCFVLVGVSEKDEQPNPVEIGNVKKVTFNELMELFQTDKKSLAPWLILALEKFNQPLRVFKKSS